MNQWKIGNVLITRIVEMEVAWGTKFILSDATGETLLEKYVNQDILIIGTHFSTPTAGHIKFLEGGGYWLDTNNAK